MGKNKVNEPEQEKKIYTDPIFERTYELLS